MALWGKNDNASNSCIFAAAQKGKTPNVANQTALFGNTTPESGKTVGQFGVDGTEIAVSNGSILSINLIDPGYGYFANAVVTVSGNGTANAQANATTGFIDLVNVTAIGSGYTAPPSVVIADPSISFNASTGVNSGLDFIAFANGTKLVNGNLVTYKVAAGNTAVVGLTANTQYYVVGANTTGVQLSLTDGGAPIDLTTGIAETGHTLVGKKAVAAATISGAATKIPHTGWVLRTEGSGGRAGRVQYEVLATLNGPVNDAADDTILKDA